MLCHESLHNQRGIYPEHPERVVEYRVDPARLGRDVKDEPRERARRVELVDIDGRVDREVPERRQVARELKRARGPHAVPDEALRVVDMGVRASLAEDRPDRLAFLDRSEEHTSE